MLYRFFILFQLADNSLGDPYTWQKLGVGNVMISMLGKNRVIAKDLKVVPTS